MKRPAVGDIIIPSRLEASKQKRIARLGAGAMGIFLPGKNADGLPFIFYLGAKAAIPL